MKDERFGHEIDETVTWRNGQDGPLLGLRAHVSPYSGQITEAVVKLDTGEVIAAHGATCPPHQLVVPSGTLDGARALYGDGPRPDMGLVTLLTAEQRAELARDAEDDGPEPYALTDRHAAALELAIRAKGYEIHEPNTVVLRRDVCSVCGNEVRMRDGRTLRRRWREDLT
jgi:hypothetical protein